MYIPTLANMDAWIYSIYSIYSTLIQCDVGVNSCTALRPATRKKRTAASESRTEDRLPAPIRTGDRCASAQNFVGQVKSWLVGVTIPNNFIWGLP